MPNVDILKLVMVSGESLILEGMFFFTALQMAVL